MARTSARPRNLLNRGDSMLIAVVESSRTACARVYRDIRQVYRDQRDRSDRPAYRGLPLPRGQLVTERRNAATRSIVPAPARWLRACARPDRTIGSRCSTGRCGRSVGPRLGPFGRTILPLDHALRFIASEGIFWAIT